MSERLTDEQLRGRTGAGWTTDPVMQSMAAELLALRARVAELEAALKQVHAHICAFGSDEDLAVIDAALKDAPTS